MLTKAYDKIGQEITKGCFIAYGHALGRSAGLRVGRVESLNFAKTKDLWTKETIENISITVLGVDDDWDDEKPKILSKRSTIFFTDRTVVLNSIPEKLAKLFETDCLANGNKHNWEVVEDYYKKCTVCGANNCPKY
jgi:hypothetical protein